MLLSMLRRRSSQTLLAAALGLGLATPALAETVYRYKTADGHWAYADDLKRVPERYRAQAKAEATGSLSTYSRYTPTDAAGTQAQQEALAARLERLRALNAQLEAASADGAPRMAGARAEKPASYVRVGNEETPVYVPTGADDEAPIVVEEKRYRIAGSAVTRHDTIVRQGDRVISVYKPRSHVTRTQDFLDEEAVDRR